MSLSRLGKLEKLASKRTDQSRVKLARDTSVLKQIEHHHSELTSISHEYQQGPVGQAEVAPQLLAQRRAFVEQLTGKLEQLAQQSEQKKKVVQQQTDEHTRRTAQHAAIELLYKKQADEIDDKTTRYEQQMLDEAARHQHLALRAINKEQGND